MATILQSLNLVPMATANDIPANATAGLTPNGGYNPINLLVDLWAGVDNSWSGANKACTQASGGTSQGSLYDSCMAGQAQAVKNAVAIDPSGAQAYSDITSGNPVAILNPFSGGLTASEIPSWVWLGLGITAVWIFNEVRGK